MTISQGAQIQPRGGSSLYQYCLLEYNPQSQGGSLLRARFAFLLALKDERGNLDFRVHPQWRELIQPEDSEYIGSLLADLPIRAKSQPDNLLKQLCSLSVGPLQTKQTGQNIADHPAVAELISTFEPV